MIIIIVTIFRAKFSYGSILAICQFIRSILLVWLLNLFYSAPKVI